MKFLIELYRDLERQGPGGTIYTERALDMITDDIKNWKALDIGCGSGSQTRVLASRCKKVTALDFMVEFLEKMKEINTSCGVKNVEAVEGNMKDMNFPENTFDLIWCEGAIYNIGFERGLRRWKKYLKENGYMGISEILWTTDERPEEIEEYWNELYPLKTLGENLKVIEACGYEIIGSFILPEEAWEDNYYRSVEEKLKALEDKYIGEVEETRREIEFYRRYNDYYSYAFFVFKRIN